MFDIWWTRYKLRWQMSLMGGCLVFLLFSAYTTYVEARYLIAGRVAPATIADVSEERISRDREPSLRIKYAFTDADGAKRSESDVMPADWLPPAAISVQYLSGKAGWSRIDGHHRLWMTIPFLVCVVGITIFLVIFYRDFQAHERRKASW
ncbi:MAG: hypothetical protein JSS51_06900 [Planctomycetes bacterium]|nr:hypothetical protein [Planctomycetota bacterium]